jgi:hypothetical protein
LSLVIRSFADEVVGAVSEVQLGKVDEEAGDKADPVSDPESFAPEIAWNQRWQQNVDEQEQNFVVAVENQLLRLEQIAVGDNEVSLIFHATTH